MATHQTFRAVVLCVFLAGCATEDRTTAAASIAVANAAVNDAATADANRYASGEVQSARKSLTDAGVAMNKADFERARLLAQQAEADADLARARASAAKAQTAVNEINESTRLLRNELGRPGQ